MTNHSRKIAATAVAVAISAGLVAGLASPAQADVFPPIKPIGLSPNLVPIPPGTTFQPIVQFPSCANAISATELHWADRTAPGFRYFGTSSVIGTTSSALARVARADDHVTCVYGKDGSHPFYITMVAISSSDYAWLFRQYDLSLTGNYGGADAYPDGQPGHNARLFYNVAVPAGVKEWSILSPSGWWITVTDYGNNEYDNTIRDVGKQFLAIQPWRG